MAHFFSPYAIQLFFFFLLLLYHIYNHLCFVAFTQLMPITHILTIPISLSFPLFLCAAAASSSPSFLFFFLSAANSLFGHCCTQLLFLTHEDASKYVSFFWVFSILSPLCQFGIQRLDLFLFNSRFRIRVSYFCLVGVANLITLLAFLVLFFEFL